MKNTRPKNIIAPPDKLLKENGLVLSEIREENSWAQVIFTTKPLPYIALEEPIAIGNFYFLFPRELYYIEDSVKQIKNVYITNIKTIKLIKKLALLIHKFYEKQENIKSFELQITFRDTLKITANYILKKGTIND